MYYSLNMQWQKRLFLGLRDLQHSQKDVLISHVHKSLLPLLRTPKTLSPLAQKSCSEKASQHLFLGLERRKSAFKSIRDSKILPFEWLRRSSSLHAKLFPRQKSREKKFSFFTPLLWVFLKDESCPHDPHTHMGMTAGCEGLKVERKL